MNNWSENPAWFLAAIIVILVVYCGVQNPGKDAQLLIAARQNSTNSIQALVHKGANVNARRKENGVMPLMIAAGNGNRESVELLLRLGADKKVKDAAGKTAADYALERDQTNLVQMLR